MKQTLVQGYLELIDGACLK